jgi:hypothetical protein
MSKGAVYVSDSGNRKIMGSKKVDATYVSIKASCPRSCPLMGEGCYAQLGYVGITSHRLDDQAKNFSPLDAARAEAKAIDESYDGGPVPENRDLRLHVSGDSKTLAGTRVIDKAVGRWKKRGGGAVWNYTHAWKHVPRSEWSNVSVLASVTNVSEVKEAHEQGYAPAIVVDQHPGDKAFQLEGCDTKWIPCPAQTRHVGCTDCRLCFNADRLHEGGFGIAFAAHGARKEAAKRHLKVVK